VRVPRPEENTTEAAALTAVLDYCATAAGPLSTPAVMQQFTGTAHEHTIAEALATAEDQGLSVEQATQELEAGVARYWQRPQRAGSPAVPDGVAALSPEEAERQRQLTAAQGTGARSR